MTAATLSFRPLSPVGGAEVQGLDLREDISDDLAGRLREAWLEHSLLLVRGQDITEEQQRRYHAVFGEPCQDGFDTANGMSYISNIADELGHNPSGALGFHLDHSFYPNPLRGLMLHALETPPEGNGGDTLFANSALAYDALPGDVKARIDGLTIRHQARLDPTHPYADHPLAYVHPKTGKHLIFVSGRHVEHVLDVSPEESAELIASLAAQIERPEFHFRHSWRPGDLIVWDNLTLQHARTDFNQKFRRHLRRLTIA